MHAKFYDVSLGRRDASLGRHTLLSQGYIGEHIPRQGDEIIIGDQRFTVEAVIWDLTKNLADPDVTFLLGSGSHA